jgi:hypothetical protein
MEPLPGKLAEAAAAGQMITLALHKSKFVDSHFCSSEPTKETSMECGRERDRP